MSKPQDDYKCPCCNESNFTRWGVSHPLMIHWVVNPGLAINELALGQRIPKLQLICKKCDGAVIDRSYIPCPSCKVLHSTRKFSRRDGFWRWRGASCPSCEARIPCMWNVFSIIILVLTSPLWYLPYRLIFANRPLKPLFSDSSPNNAQKPVTRKVWFLMGLFWGVLMWLIMSLVPALKNSDMEQAFIGVPIWLIGGLCFGFFMWFFMGRTTKSNLENKTQKTNL